MSNNICNQITLCDGRRIGFSEFGDRQGRPVFYFHGFPGSRLEAKLAEKISLDTHVRFIGIDRPGYGLSSFKPGRTFLDWADDVSELADAMGIDRFSILGVSGGGLTLQPVPVKFRIAWIGWVLSVEWGLLMSRV